MINILHIKNDFKQIFKSPIMVLFFVLPLFLAVLARFFITWLIPYLARYIVIDATPYYSYILAAIITFAPMSLGIVTGFMMLDDRDGKVFDLMQVTPLGASGYIINRVFFPTAASFLYTFIMYFIMDIYHLPAVTLVMLALLMSALSVIIALCLFLIATDKVKGLTYAKALNLFSLFTLADLLGLKWLSTLSHAIPTYWVTKIVQSPANVWIILLAFIISAVWIVGVLWAWRRKQG